MRVPRRGRRHAADALRSRGLLRCLRAPAAPPNSASDRRAAPGTAPTACPAARAGTRGIAPASCSRPSPPPRSAPARRAAAARPSARDSDPGSRRDPAAHRPDTAPAPRGPASPAPRSPGPPAAGPRRTAGAVAAADRYKGSARLAPRPPTVRPARPVRAWPVRAWPVRAWPVPAARPDRPGARFRSFGCPPSRPRR